MNKSDSSKVQSRPGLLVPIEHTRGKKRILLVDDDSTVRKVLSQILEISGYTVLVAEDGIKGLKIIIDDAQVDLMLCDVVMPHMQGPELCRLAREKNTGLRTILMSGFPMFEPNKEWSQVSDAFLMKPFRRSELLSKIARVLDQQPFDAQASQSTHSDLSSE
jgi:CheY-like chemotaxis protein